MTRYFMRDTPLAGLEAAMMLPPRFANRQSGVIVLSRFHDTKESTNCHDCVEWHSKKKCDIQCCPWLAERLAAGNVSYGEMLKECFHEIENKGLKTRLRHLAAGFHGKLFKDGIHQQRFEGVKNSLRILNDNSPDCHIAALFLLTADETLWQVCKRAVTCNEIFFGNIKLHGISTDGYALFQMAKTLCTGQPKVTPSELADRSLISDPLLSVLVNAILITRFGAGVLVLDHEEMEVLQ